MLYQLSIRNVAIIEAVDLTLGDGLNILTGETGAGKSIVIDAVNLVLGGRADKDLIRSGESTARVEAAFYEEDPAVQAQVEACGFAFEENMLVIVRELSVSGRSMCRINGHMATQAQLRQVTRHLIDIHGQHENHSLLDPRRHCAMLDSYGAAPLKKVHDQVASLHEACLSIAAQIDALSQQGVTPEQRVDILRFQLEELERAGIQEGEEEALESRRRILSHAERIRDALEAARVALEGDEEDGTGVQEGIAAAAMAMVRFRDVDASFAALADTLESIAIEVDEAVTQLRRMREGFDDEADSLEEVQERLEQLHHLSRKYGCRVDELEERRLAMAQELDDWMHWGEHVQSLQESLAAQQQAWQRAADELTPLRRRTAVELEAAITAQLQDLGMGRARFLIELIPQNPDGKGIVTRANGQEEVRLMISTNRGEAVRPLEKVASGGELSRIMLALKNVFAESDGIHCQIFDEIDAGISGNMARVVAEKLARISRNRQVICITHSPQIAAMADAHYRIEKVAEGERTVTEVEPMGRDSRFVEISRLVGADMSDETSNEHARRMIAWCDAFKAELAAEKGRGETP